MAQAKLLLAFWPLFVRYSHGIAMISAMCRAKGIETQLHQLRDLDEFRVLLAKSNFDYVGFSCVTKHDFMKSLPFIVSADQMGQQVLLGGVYARNGVGNDIPLKHVCRGDGETLADFILDGDETVFNEKMFTDDLNALPLPDYELFKDIPFVRGMPILDGKKVLPYYLSRGCPYRCPFCQAAMQPYKIRIRTRVEEDLKQITEKYQPDIIFIGDELPPYYSTPWIKSWGEFRHPFVAYIRADIPSDSLMWMIDRGMKGCAFGVEAGDEKYRNDVLGKNLSDADIFRTVGILKEFGIEYVPSYMMNTPHETFSLRKKTYDFAKKVGGHTMIYQYEKLGD